MVKFMWSSPWKSRSAKRWRSFVKSLPCRSDLSCIRCLAVFFGAYYFLAGVFGIYAGVNGFLLMGNADVLQENLTLKNAEETLFSAAWLWVIFGSVMLLVALFQIHGVWQSSRTSLKAVTIFLVPIVLVLAAYTTHCLWTYIRLSSVLLDVSQVDRESFLRLTRWLVVVSGSFCGSIGIGLIVNIVLYVHTKPLERSQVHGKITLLDADLH